MSIWSIWTYFVLYFAFRPFVTVVQTADLSPLHRQLVMADLPSSFHHCRRYLTASVENWKYIFWINFDLNVLIIWIEISMVFIKLAHTRGIKPMTNVRLWYCNLALWINTMINLTYLHWLCFLVSCWSNFWLLCRG